MWGLGFRMWGLGFRMWGLVVKKQPFLFPQPLQALDLATQTFAAKR